MNILLIFPGFILAIITIVIYEIKIREPRNKVHFYVTRDKGGRLLMWLGKPKKDARGFWGTTGAEICLCGGHSLINYNLNANDYVYLTHEDEPLEVYINMED